MKSLLTLCAAVAPLFLSLPGPASADDASVCRDGILKGRYVFTATGFTRPPASTPGTPWVPKAILEVIHFNGDGTLTTPMVVVANPFGDFGAVLQPPMGSNGLYSIDASCSGTVEFLSAANIKFRIQVGSPNGDTIWMIQTNPANNVFEGSGRRLR